MKFLFIKSIWAPDAIPADEWKYRNLKRILFPIVDFVFFLGGFSAANYGIPAISEFFPDPFVDFFAYVFSLMAFICLLGVSFPSLWPLEITGRSVLLGLVVGYGVALFMLTAIGEGNRGFVLTFALIATVLIMWRLSLLGGEWQDRRIKQKGG